MKNKIKSAIKSPLGQIATAGLIILAIHSFIIAPYKIPTESMDPEIPPKSYILTNRMAYGYSPASLPFGTAKPDSPVILARPIHRGDIVIFRAPGHQSVILVKRIIGLPGETIKIENDSPIINGKKSKEIPQAETDNKTAVIYSETLPGAPPHNIIIDNISSNKKKNTGEYKIPPNQYFVMGDNRDHSFDSRYQKSDNPDAIGTIPRPNIIGSYLPVP